MKISNIANLEKYPISFPNSDLYSKIVNQYRKELDDIGCCCLPNFIRQESISRMQEEIKQKRKKIYWSRDSHNPYFTENDSTLPKIILKIFFNKGKTATLHVIRLVIALIY